MSFLSDIFGKKPVVPQLKPIDLGKEQGVAVQNNLNVLPEAEKLTEQSNLFSAEQVDKMLRRFTPDLDSITGQISSNLDSWLKGEVPEDVQRELMTSSAGRALEGGYAGSGMGRNLAARDLGLTSLKLMDEGLRSAESWMATTARLYEPHMMDVKSMFVTPEKQASFDVNERNAKFNRDWMASQIKAMPDPVMNAVYQAVHQVGMAFIHGYTGSSGPSDIKTQDYSKVAGNPGQTYGPGGYSTAPVGSEGYGGYDMGSYMSGTEDFGGASMGEGDFGGGFGGGMGGMA